MRYGWLKVFRRRSIASGPDYRSLRSKVAWRRRKAKGSSRATGNASVLPSAAVVSSMTCWSVSSAPEKNVDNRVPELAPARLELGRGARHEAAFYFFEPRMLRKHFFHLQPVFGPVGRGMQNS